MSIKIKTEKVVNSNGEYCKRITEITALRYHQLPILYKQSKERPIVCKANNIEAMFCYNRNERLPCEKVYKKGMTYSVVSIQKLIRHCYEAGEHLMDRNKELKEKRAVWSGSETVII